MKIQICGPSGAGKTTLAKFIAEQFGIPYIHTDGPGLRKLYGCESHSDIIKMTAADIVKGNMYQYELLAQRSQLSMGDSYVMDRSFVDSIAYFLLQNSAFNTEQETVAFISKTLAVCHRCTHLIMIPPLYTNPEEDGVRIQNLQYQKMTWEMMKYAAEEYRMDQAMNYLTPLLIETYDLDERKRIVFQYLNTK